MRAGREPLFDLIERILAPCRSSTPDEVERAVAYRFHAFSADQWRSGRVLLLGDAAHMMPPPRDSYQQERKPHADAVIRSSERLGRVVMTRSVGTCRDAALRRASATREGRDYLEQMRYQPRAVFTDGLVGGTDTLNGLPTGSSPPPCIGELPELDRDRPAPGAPSLG